MATTQLLQREDDLLLSSPYLDSREGDGGKSSGMSIEKKIEFLENLTGKVTNRRSRRWLNDRLLMELVPRLNAEEVRGLFAPPPWGKEVPPSAFCVANVGNWDRFRNIDMDKEVNVIHALEHSLTKRKHHIDADKMAVLNAWRRINSRTREALRRSFLSELIQTYEFYNLASETVTEWKGVESLKMTMITKRKRSSPDFPNITLSHFLKMTKEGNW